LVSKLAPNAPASGSVLRLVHTASGLAQVGEVDCVQWNPVPWGTRAGITEVPWDGPSPTGLLLRDSAHAVPNRLHRVSGLAWAARARDDARRAEARAAANADAARRVGGGRVIVVRDGTRLPPRVVRPRATSARPVLTFVGLMKYAPITDAAEWLARAITPAL